MVFVWPLLWASPLGLMMCWVCVPGISLLAFALGFLLCLACVVFRDCGHFRWVYVCSKYQFVGFTAGFCVVFCPGSQFGRVAVRWQCLSRGDGGADCSVTGLADGRRRVRLYPRVRPGRQALRPPLHHQHQQHQSPAPVTSTTPQTQTTSGTSPCGRRQEAPALR